jgi:hypothetical protein
MKHSRTLRRLTAAAVALVATVASAPVATADDALPEPTRTLAEVLPGTAVGTAPVEDAPAALSASSTSVVNTQQSWDFFRLLNTARTTNNLEPAIPNGRLNELATSWALGQSEAGTARTDDTLAGKLPAGWHDAQQGIYTTYDDTAAGAVEWMAQLWMDLDWIEPGVTDVGIGLVERPLFGSLKEYTLYVIGAGYAHSAPQAGEMTLYRFFRPDTGTHFYSTSAGERNTVIRNAAFRYEGQVAYVMKPSTTTAGTRALNRFYQPGSGTHFYTSTQSEYDRVLGFPQYSLDGVAGKVHTTSGGGRVPMYRFFRPASGTHFYTASATEMQQVRAMPGYAFEGVAFYLRRAS